MTRVWQKIIEQGADPARREYGGESAAAVAREMASPACYVVERSLCYSVLRVPLMRAGVRSDTLE
eukprot:7381935-Prymnesium_polylepis.2